MTRQGRTGRGIGATNPLVAPRAIDDLDDSDEDPWTRRYRAAGGGPHTERFKVRWRAAMQWRHRLCAALYGSGLSFSQWLVLETTRGLLGVTGDAVNQVEIGVSAGLGKASVSKTMRQLEEKGFVSRGPSATGKAWRVIITASALKVLSNHRARVEAASADEKALVENRS